MLENMTAWLQMYRHCFLKFCLKCVLWACYESELASLINKLNSNKADGPDSIGPKLLLL